MKEYRGYNLTSHPNYSTTLIKAKGQGKVPLALTGQFTSIATAEKAVDGYLASLLKGKKSNGKAESTSTA